MVTQQFRWDDHPRGLQESEAASLPSADSRDPHFFSGLQPEKDGPVSFYHLVIKEEHFQRHCLGCRIGAQGCTRVYFLFLVG